ncbi:hypothetical protein L1887_32316 [Cichorium endivia]|nr:hypothetical protein L1887_32309 [Cichorium endivia]KAI3503860.1 hypothetical protein L1887_32316 [Cichorium endivia]
MIFRNLVRETGNLSGHVKSAINRDLEAAMQSIGPVVEGDSNIDLQSLLLFHMIWREIAARNCDEPGHVACKLLITRSLKRH